MSTTDFPFGLILLVVLASLIVSSCACSIRCPCGGNTNQFYAQCIYDMFHEKYTCERWANCLTCADNTSYCITCPPGRSGPTCSEDSRPTAPRATTTTCPDPGSIQNGYRRLVNGLPSRLSRVYGNGQSFQYFCNEGYVLEGHSELHCLLSGMWSSNTPRCQRLPIDPSPYCPDPGQITYGSYRNNVGSPASSQRYAVGESVTYYCHNGYELVGKELITCTASGSWPMRPLCRRTTSAPKPLDLDDGTAICADPGSIQNGYRRLINDMTSKITEMYKIGQTFEYFCNAGYELRGKNVLTCSNSGYWTNNKPWCQGTAAGTATSGTTMVCPNPTVDPNGDMEELFPIDPRQKGQKFPAGSQLSFTCRSGYEMKGTNTITCLINGQWTSDPPTCAKISGSPPPATPVVCPKPTVDPNGDMEEIFPIDPRQKRKGFEAGSQISFTCRSGYVMEGTPTITCLINGQWTSNSPTCVRLLDDVETPQPSATPIVCPSPIVDPNGEMEEIFPIDSRRGRPGFEAGSQVSFTCKSGYEMEGTHTLTCLRTGRWSSESPMCSRIAEDMDCGRSIIPPASEITTSRKVNEGEFPWIVLVATDDSKPFPGMLLDHTTVLTVAHYLANQQSCKLYFFKNNRTKSIDNRFAETRWSSEIIIHPEYNSHTYDNDIAIVKFYPAISYSVNVEPICAPTLQSSTRNIVHGKTGYLIGWGFTKDNQESADLMVAPLPIKSSETCIRDFQRINPLLKITRGMFCAGFPDSQKPNDFCYEGRGAAVVFYNSEIKRFTLEGLASRRPPGRCYGTKNNIIFMKVSYYVEWIMQNLRN